MLVEDVQELKFTQLWREWEWKWYNHFGKHTVMFLRI